MNTYNKLFEPFTFKNSIHIRNRVIMAPMTTWSSNDDFTISDEEVEYYKKRVNGVGMVITGCTHVTPEGIGFTNEFAAFDDKFIPSLKKLANAAKSGGAPAILQILHAGNKAEPSLTPNGEVVAPSAILSDPTLFRQQAVMPRELTEVEIISIIKSFGETTRRAIEAGFDGIELHGAHSFLIQNFFSPHFNRRTDRWGNSLENRLRFAVEVVKEVKQVIELYAKRPFILGYRISPEEQQEDGLKLSDTFVLIDRLIEEQVDYLHFSLFNIITQRSSHKDFSDKPIAAILSEYVNERIPIIAAGGVAEPQKGIEALEYGLSMIAIGHALIINPDWVELAQKGQVEKITKVLKLNTTEEKRIPKKLLNIFHKVKGFIEMEE